MQLLLGWWVYKGGFSYILAILLGWYTVLLFYRLFAEYSYRNGRWLFAGLMMRVSSRTAFSEPIASNDNLVPKDELLSGSSEGTESLIALVRNNRSR